MQIRRGSLAVGALAAIALGLAALLLGISAAAASAVVSSKAPVTLYKFPRVPPTGGNEALAVDLQGSVWFEQTYEESAEAGGEPRFPGQVVRMSREGQITVAAKSRAHGFAVAADNSVWFPGFAQIVRVAPDGSISEFPLPWDSKVVLASGPIVAGADGNIWFSAGRSFPGDDGVARESEAIIGRLSPDGELTEFDLPGRGGYPTRLVAGPDGNVWFTEYIEDRIGRITPAGEIQQFQLARYSRPNEIVSGPDGALWFMVEHDEGPAIGRITTAGAVTEFPLGSGERLGAGTLAAGPDGRLWFVAEARTIWRISTTGRISRLELPSLTPRDIAVGPEGSVWYTSDAEPPCLPGDAVCGDGGYYQSGVIGRIDPAPLSTDIAGVRLTAGGRKVKLWLACLDGISGETCKGLLRLRGGGRKAVKRRYALATDLTRAISVPLDRRTRTNLARTGRLNLRITTTVSGGRTTTESVGLRLRSR